MPPIASASSLRRTSPAEGAPKEDQAGDDPRVPGHAPEAHQELRQAANAERSRVREIGRERQEAEETRRAAREALVQALSRGEDGAAEQRALEKAEAQAAKRWTEIEEPLIDGFVPPTPRSSTTSPAASRPSVVRSSSATIGRRAVRSRRAGTPARHARAEQGSRCLDAADQRGERRPACRIRGTGARARRPRPGAEANPVGRFAQPHAARPATRREGLGGGMTATTAWRPPPPGEHGAVRRSSRAGAWATGSTSRRTAGAMSSESATTSP